MQATKKTFQTVAEENCEVGWTAVAVDEKYKWVIRCVCILLCFLCALRLHLFMLLMFLMFRCVSLMFLMKVMFLMGLIIFCVWALGLQILVVLAFSFSYHVAEDEEQNNHRVGGKPIGICRGRRDSFDRRGRHDSRDSSRNPFGRLRSWRGRGIRGPRWSPNSLSYVFKVICSEDIKFLISFVFE